MKLRVTLSRAPRMRTSSLTHDLKFVIKSSYSKSSPQPHNPVGSQAVSFNAAACTRRTWRPLEVQKESDDHCAAPSESAFSLPRRPHLSMSFLLSFNTHYHQLNLLLIPVTAKCFSWILFLYVIHNLLIY